MSAIPLISVAAGDIVLVRYPYSDGVGAKKRPALVVSALDSYGDAVLMGITTQQHAHGVVPLRRNDIASGGLPRPSWVKTSTVNSIHQSRFISVIASVHPAALMAIRSQMCPRLGCP